MKINLTEAQKKKYFKIIMLVIFVLFVLFVIIRKVNHEEKQSIQTISKKQFEPKTEKIKTEKEIKDNEVRLKLKNKEELNNIVATEKEKIKIKKIENDFEKHDKQEKIQQEKKEVVIDNKTYNNMQKIIDKDVKKTIRTKIVNKKQISDINIYNIYGLNEIKHKIKLKNNSFEYNGVIYLVGDNIGKFRIEKIGYKKIRFKQNERSFYSLRFFEQNKDTK